MTAPVSRYERGRWVYDHLPPVDRLLDVGTSDGHFLRAWSARAAMTVGVDVDPSLQRCEGGVERCTAAAAALPFPTATFDAVTLVEVLEHVPRGTERAVVEELRRVLRPGGTLVLTTPHRGWFRWLDPITPLQLSHGGEPHRHYRLDEVATFLDGLFVIETEHRSSLLLFPLAFWFPAGRGRRRLALRRWMTDWDYRHRFGRAAYNLAVVARAA